MASNKEGLVMKLRAYVEPLVVVKPPDFARALDADASARGASTRFWSRAT